MTGSISPLLPRPDTTMNTTTNNNTKVFGIRIMRLSGLAVVIVLLLSCCVYTAKQLLAPSIKIIPIDAFIKPDIRQSNGSRFDNTFPNLVHVMWKTATNMPPETQKWQHGCRNINTDLTFHQYDDNELLAFVTKNYPNYLPLFSQLKGVHMADMARVLVTYHFGGLYMDLDFFCVRPFRCIHQLLPDSIQSNDDILIVSLETTMHGTIMRKKDRVVIQDFFYSTPKHPFFLFMLEDRMAKFTQNNILAKKAPFGYHIEADVDAFRASPMSKELGPSGGKAVVFELREDVLHSLADVQAWDLGHVCYSNNIPEVSKASCEDVRKGAFFQPSRNTIAVHMWFHTYYGWFFFRGLRNKAAYDQVEKSLPQTMQC